MEDVMKRLFVSLTLLLVILIQGVFIQAQETTVEQLLSKGRAAMEEAITAYPKAYPDQPLWREAIAKGRQAVELAPNTPEPLRFLAEAYSRSNFYGPAYQTWVQLMELGQPLDTDAIPLFRMVAFELAYNAYDLGDKAQALEYFQKLIDVVPYDKDAYVWAGRILLEMNRPKEAIAYWQTAVDRDPTDERSKYFLQLARDQATWGIDAVNAFREGVEPYDQGDLIAARERFNRAVGRNEMYAEAWAWLGRTEFEQGNYANAVTYYREASRLEPQNETYSYFFEESQRRSGIN
jgi:tetratricopeptide (TPR) repeat protein